jgi:hypothetical protein
MKPNTKAVHSNREQVEKLLSCLIGRPCWNVCALTPMSFLSLQFGLPSLDILEPRQSSSTSPRVRALLARRHIRIHGQWRFSTYCCDWSIFDGTRTVGKSSSPTKKREHVADFLDGQKVTSVALIPRGLRTVITFDLGGRLETRPYDRKLEQWSLRMPGNIWLALRADKQVSLHSGKTKPDEKIWTHLDESDLLAGVPAKVSRSWRQPTSR